MKTSILFLTWLVVTYSIWETNEIAAYGVMALTIWLLIPQRIIDRLI